MNSETSIPDHGQLAVIKDVQANEKRATITGPFGSSIGKRFFVSEGVPVIRGNNLSYKSGTFYDNDFVYITHEKADELKGYIAEPGDLVFTAAGTIGQVSLIPFNARFKKYIISNKQMRVRFDLKKVDVFYAYYWFSSPVMRAFIKRQDTGSTIPLINLSVLRSLPISIPPLQKQRAISTILKSLDDKIGINYQINQTLEQMAQAIFKSWFVDFEPVKAKIAARVAGGSEEDVQIAAMSAISGKGADQLAQMQSGQPEQYAELCATAELFPAEMQDSELGEIPAGWEIKPFSGWVKITKGKSITKSKVVPGNVPVIAGGLSPAYWHNEHNVTGPAITISASGANAGYVNIYHQNIWSSDSSYINKDSTPFFHVAYSYLRFFQNRIFDMQTGGAQPHIYPKDFNRLIHAVPCGKTLGALEKIIASYLKYDFSFRDESWILSNIRDTLLPKLLSGELSVSDAEATVKAGDTADV